MLERGSRIGPYEVQLTLGVGGMGEVYRARDTKLARDVALKILPEAFAVDRDRLARFTREAQVLATLNHPHIAAIYGFEDTGPVRALVLELVDGRTLAARSTRRPRVPPGGDDPHRPPDRRRPGAAHEHGGIHRGLKRPNIKLRLSRCQFARLRACQADNAYPEVSGPTRLDA